MDKEIAEITHAFTERGDLGHLGLLVWAGLSSLMLIWTLRELGAANRRMNDLVNEILRFVAEWRRG